MERTKADESEHLVLDAELGELWKLEGAFDSHARVCQPHPLDDERLPAGQFREFLPVHRASLTFLSMTLIFSITQGPELRFCDGGAAELQHAGQKVYERHRWRGSA